MRIQVKGKLQFEFIIINPQSCKFSILGVVFMQTVKWMSFNCFKMLCNTWFSLISL